jgi:hypothetical protein
LATGLTVFIRGSRNIGLSLMAAALLTVAGCGAATGAPPPPPPSTPSGTPASSAPAAGGSPTVGTPAPTPSSASPTAPASSPSQPPVGATGSVASRLIPPSGQTSYFVAGQLGFSQAQGVGSVNGAQTQLTEGAVEQLIASVFRSTLFATTSNGVMTVYSPGWTPVTAALTNNGAGSYSISYSEQSGNSTSSFFGTLRGSQISGSYQQEGAGGNVVNGQENIAGTNISGAFTAPITWIAADDIPGAPTDLQIRSGNGAVALTWQAAPGNVDHYAIYRIIGLVNSSQTYLSSTRSTSFTDTTALSLAPSGGDEIFYYVYAVGPTGVENPLDAFGYLLTS